MEIKVTGWSSTVHAFGIGFVAESDADIAYFQRKLLNVQRNMRWCYLTSAERHSTVVVSPDIGFRWQAIERTNRSTASLCHSGACSFTSHPPLSLENRRGRVSTATAILGEIQGTAINAGASFCFSSTVLRLCVIFPSRVLLHIRIVL